MKKLFALDLGMRSTACNYDPCIVGDTRPKVVCDDCKVTFISDRFLGEDFQRKVIGKALKRSLQKYTYVVIADTVGCNLNCWFCYAWKFLDKNVAEKKCETSFVDPKRLAEQFFCKLKQVSSLSYMVEQIENKRFQSENRRKQSIRHVKLNLPLSRVRISGGEPIFSNEEVLIDREDEENIHLSTVKYWLNFFESLDELVERLKQGDLIHLVDVDKWDGTSPHLSCLSEVTGRLNVRFDTNGILFANERITSAFIGGLFELYVKGRLNNLFVQIDYSIKGATPVEYYWSQSRSLPVIQGTNKLDFSVENHPQYHGYERIVDAINGYARRTPGFRDCADITVEKGIDHSPTSKVFLYYPRALDWENFSRITGINFSSVINCFDLNFRWYPKAKMYRYSNRGAVIKMESQGESVDTTTNSFEDLFSFRSKHGSKDDFKTIVYPVGKPVKPKRIDRIQRRKLTPSQTTLVSYQPGWILSGNEENWKVALDNKLWGASPKLKHLWGRMNEGDRLFFYTTRPISGVIGYGKAEERFVGDKPLWPDEIREGKVKYPYRIRFKIIRALEESDWRRKRVPITGLNVVFYHGINAIFDKRAYEKLINLVENLKEL